jgi:hypothetical protein
MTSQTSIT